MAFWGAHCCLVDDEDDETVSKFEDDSVAFRFAPRGARATFAAQRSGYSHAKSRREQRRQAETPSPSHFDLTCRHRRQARILPPPRVILYGPGACDEVLSAALIWTAEEADVAAVKSAPLFGIWTAAPQGVGLPGSAQRWSSLCAKVSCWLDDSSWELIGGGG